MYHETKKGVDFYEFDSLGDLVNYCEETPPKTSWNDHLYEAGWSRPGDRYNDSDFLGTETPQGAIDLARFGWKEGREKMTANLQVIANSNTHQRLHVLGMGMAGFLPIVPAFVAGRPDCMLTRKDTIKAKKRTLTLWVNRTAPSRSSTEDIENYGAGTLSVIDALETNGVSVEIFVLTVSQGEGNEHCLKTCIKKAGDCLDVDSCAFSLVHSSYQRRLKFKQLSTTKDCTRAWRGQGKAIDLKESLIPEDVIYLPSISGVSSHHYETPTAAADYISGLVNQWAVNRFNEKLISEDE